MKFAHHKYTWSKPFGSIRHDWSLVGPKGGISFHVGIHPSAASAGLEFHSRSGEGAPNHLDCAIIGGPCWHDGTSLYAMETLWPRIEPLLKISDHLAIFNILEKEYDDHFERNDNA